MTNKYGKTVRLCVWLVKALDYGKSGHIVPQTFCTKPRFKAWTASTYLNLIMTSQEVTLIQLKTFNY